MNSYPPEVVPEQDAHLGYGKPGYTAALSSQTPYSGAGSKPESVSPYLPTTTDTLVDTTYAGHDNKRGRTVMGCGIVTFLLIIIGILIAAVIGLAVGTGVETSKASDASNKLPSMTNIIDDGCGIDPSGVTGTNYTSPVTVATFKRYCNKDTPNKPIQAVISPDFKGCMDACANFNSNAPSFRANTTCVGVSFVPSWLNRTAMIDVNAPGNCYLKPGPISVANLTSPGTPYEVDAALIQ
jgi:hypothetical protein